MPGSRRRPARALRLLAERVILPATVAAAGQRLGWHLVRAASRWPRLYRLETISMLRGHARLSGNEETPTLGRQFRRQLLMEHAGCLRSRIWGPGRASKIIGHVEGEWPAHGPFLAYGFHRAGGFSVLDHLAAAGHRPVFLHTPPADPTGIERWVARLESRQLSRLGDGELLTTGGSYERIRELARLGRVVVALTDAPPAAGRSSLECRVLGLTVRLREGLFRLAADLDLPVALFFTSLDSSGRYSLSIRTLSPPHDPGALARSAAEMLETSLRLDAAGWLYLNGLEAFLPGHPGVPANPD